MSSDIPEYQKLVWPVILFAAIQLPSNSSTNSILTTLHAIQAGWKWPDLLLLKPISYSKPTQQTISNSPRHHYIPSLLFPSCGNRLRHHPRRLPAVEVVWHKARFSITLIGLPLLGHLPPHLRRQPAVVVAVVPRSNSNKSNSNQQRWRRKWNTIRRSYSNNKNLVYM